MGTLNSHTQSIHMKFKKYITKFFIGVLQNYDCPWKDILLSNADIINLIKDFFGSNLDPLKMHKLFTEEIDAYIKHNTFYLI